jgi:phage terminase large subunit
LKVELNPKYKNLFKHTGRYNVITGGRGSAKSFSVSVFLIMLTFEAGHKILFTRLTMVSANISIIPELVDKIELLGLSEHFRITKTEIINTTSGSSIIFMGIRSSNGDNTARLKSISGITTLIVEEAEELTDETLFDKVNLSIRNKGKQNRVILILNPATKTHWIYNKFFVEKGVKEGYNGVKDDTCYIHTTYEDNKHLSDDFINEIEQLKATNPEKFNHIVLGGWLEKSEGVIFSNWEYGNFPTDVDTYFGADWGWSIDPSTLIEVHIDKKERKIYLKEHLYQKGLTTTQLTRIFKKIAGDKLIVADSAEGRLIEEIKTEGLNIRKCKKGAGSVKDGIALMKDYQLIVDYKSLNLVEELNNYSWRKDGEEPIDRYNHLLDACRYIITDRLKEQSGVYYIY